MLDADASGAAGWMAIHERERMKTEVVAVIGAGGIGMAIARRQGFGKHILLADFNEKLLAAAQKDLEATS